MRRAMILSLMAFFLCRAGWGEIVTAKALSSVDKIKAGGEYWLAVVMEIATPYHINANEPGDEFMIPTALEMNEIPGVTIGKILYPKPITKKFAFSDNPLAVYQGTQTIFFSVKISSDYKEKEWTLEGRVTYQACDDNNCLPPGEAGFSLKIPLANCCGKVESINKEIFDKRPAPDEKK